MLPPTPMGPAASPGLENSDYEVPTPSCWPSSLPVLAPGLRGLDLNPVYATILLVDQLFNPSEFKCVRLKVGATSRLCKVIGRVGEITPVNISVSALISQKWTLR